MPPRQVGANPEIFQDAQQSQADRPDRRLCEPGVSQGQVLVAASRLIIGVSEDRSGPTGGVCLSSRDLIRQGEGRLHARKPASQLAEHSDILRSLAGEEHRESAGGGPRSREDRRLCLRSPERCCRLDLRAGSGRRQRFQPGSGRPRTPHRGRLLSRSATTSKRKRWPLVKPRAASRPRRPDVVPVAHVFQCVQRIASMSAAISLEKARICTSPSQSTPGFSGSASSSTQ